MLGKTVLCLWTSLFYSIAAQEQCTDMRGRQVSHGLHYVPGPDTCTLCVCDNGLPKVCKAVLCSPPQDCRSFRVGNTCCEFICLDDVVKPAESAEANVRMAAGGAAAVVLVTVALVVYRVRKQKRRRPPHTDDQRSLTSIGYISGSMGYMGGTCETALAAWKPPSNYLPRGEAPPPYDEVIAQCRPDNMRYYVIRMNEAYHRTYPTALEALPRPDDMSPHAYGNLPRPQQIANTQNCYNAPLLQTVHPAENREPVPSAPHHSLVPTMSGVSVSGRLAGSLGAISARHAPHSLHALHRTIPRISTAVDTTLLDTPIGFNRADRSLHNEIRRSFHKPSENNRHSADTGRSMPRNLNLASANDITKSIDIALDDTGRTRLAGGTRAQSDECDVSVPQVPQHSPHPQQQAVPQPAPQLPHVPLPLPQPAQHAQPQHAPTLPLTVDKPSCDCSYEGTNAPGTEDGDDYRSECENCKAASSSRWAQAGEAEWQQAARGPGTLTLQRRAPLAAPPPATATLPQPVTKQRTVMGPPSNWENWFNTIPDSDTESEEEDHDDMKTRLNVTLVRSG